MRIRHVTIAAALMLAGCGPMVDNAANVPLRGKWEQTTRMLNLVANDVWIDRENVPFDLPKDQTEVKPCFEPTLKTADEINRDVLKGGGKACKFAEIERDGDEFSSTGTCMPEQRMGGTIKGTLEMTGREAPDKIGAKINGSLIHTTASGASERVRFAVETSWKRLGDCGS